MKSPSRNFAGATRLAGPFDGGFPLSDLRRLGRAEYGDVVAIEMARVNLLLTGADSIVQNILGSILQELHTPIVSWYPGDRLVLPPVAHTGTMILHDVSAMTREDQVRLLEWTEQAAGKTQIVSTAPTPLFPLVRAGVFNDTLYYRLNVVFIDTTEQWSQN